MNEPRGDRGRRTRRPSGDPSGSGWADSDPAAIPDWAADAPSTPPGRPGPEEAPRRPARSSRPSHPRDWGAWPETPGRTRRSSSPAVHPYWEDGQRRTTDDGHPFFGPGRDEATPGADQAAVAHETVRSDVGEAAVGQSPVGLDGGEQPASLDVGEAATGHPPVGVDIGEAAADRHSSDSGADEVAAGRTSSFGLGSDEGVTGHHQFFTAAIDDDDGHPFFGGDGDMGVPSFALGSGDDGETVRGLDSGDDGSGPLVGLASGDDGSTPRRGARRGARRRPARGGSAGDADLPMEEGWLGATRARDLGAAPLEALEPGPGEGRSYGSAGGDEGVSAPRSLDSGERDESVDGGGLLTAGLGQSVDGRGWLDSAAPGESVDERGVLDSAAPGDESRLLDSPEPDDNTAGQGLFGSAESAERVEAPRSTGLEAGWGQPDESPGETGNGLFDTPEPEKRGRRGGKGSSRRGRYGSGNSRGSRGGGGWRSDGPDAGSAAAQAPPADPESVARNICLRLLAMAPKTRAQLAEAMRKRMVPDDVAERVLDRFTELGFINDEAFAEAWVDSRHHGRGLAKRALAAELRQRGVDGDTVKDAVERLDPDQEAETARRLVDRKLASTRGLDSQARVRRLAGMLARKGYSAGVAYRVVREALEQEGVEVEEDDPF